MASFSGSFTRFQPLAHHWHTQDHTTDDFDVTNRICKTQPFDTILKDYATTRQVNVEFGGYGLLGTLASYFGPGTTYPMWSSATRSDGVLYISESG